MPPQIKASDTYEALLWDVVTNAHRYQPRDGDNVLDLGAHFGMFALYCAARGGIVDAYEPGEMAYQELRHTAEVAEEIGLGKIWPIKKAVWTENRIMPLFQSQKSSGEHSLIQGDLERADLEHAEWLQPVECLSLQYILSTRPWWACLKMDIEGAEHAVLAATPVEMFHRVRFLTMELHNNLLGPIRAQEVGELLRSRFPRVHPIHLKSDPTLVVTYLCYR